jgi:hypothetical protein
MEYACSQRKDLQSALWKATRDIKQRSDNREVLTNVHKLRQAGEAGWVDIMGTTRLRLWRAEPIDTVCCLF